MSVTTNNVLYWSGTISDSQPNVDAQLTQTNQSGFTTVLLWSLHVNGNDPAKGFTLGDLYWNDTPLVVSKNGKPVFDPTNVFTKLASRLNALLKGGTVNKIFWSIGAGGTSDFTNLTKLVSTSAGQKTLQDNFSVLAKALPMITGYDFDDEDDYNVGTVAYMTEFFATNFKAQITYCPYWDQQFWEQCMEAVYKKMNQQPVAWWNLQCYSGGGGNDPVQWMQNIKQNQSANGVKNPATFIVPGYAAANSQGDGPGICPPDVCNTFSGFQGKVGGGFIWNSQHIFDNGQGQCSGGTATAAQYAQAITNGLNGKCQ